MISCKNCQTKNGIDAKFCKSCGIALDDEAIQEAKLKHEQMVQEGYALFNAGRTDDALLVAQAAAEEDQASTGALSLLGMCMERQGQLAEALECFERVAQLNPDSTVDRMKVTQLRNSLTTHLRTDDKRNHRLAFLAAGAMVVVVAAAGLILATMNARKAVASQGPLVQTAQQADAKGFPQTLQATLTQPQSAVTKQEAPAADFPATRQAEAKQPQTPNGEPSDEADNLKPVTPNVIISPQPISSQENASNGAKDPDPKPDGGSVQDKPNDPPMKPAEDEGSIQITVTHTAHEDAGDPNQLQTLMKTARNQFLIGQFEPAARSYASALKAGGDPATINQRLGMCFQKLGKQTDAVAAYGRAAAAYQTEINAGQGDPNRLRSGLAACKQALKLLQS